MGVAPVWTAYQLTLSSSKQRGEFDCHRNVYRTERGSANGDSGRRDCQAPRDRARTDSEHVRAQVGW